MLLRLHGLDDLDGEYELDPSPNLKECIAFRKAAGLTPSELTEAITNGGLEVLPLYLFTAMARQGRLDLALRILEVPIAQWEGVERIEAAEEDEEELPPVSALDEPVSESATD